MNFTRRSFLKSTAITLGAVWLPGCSDDRTGRISTVGQSATNGTDFWVDAFQRPDGAVGNGWTTVNGATAEIVGRALRRTDSGTYRILYNPAGGSLPANYYITATVPHSLLTSNVVNWGIIGRYNGQDGIKVMWPFGGPNGIVAGNGGANNDILITVTGGIPSSWEVVQNHTVTLQFAGSLVTLYLDGQEYGHFTASTNIQTGTSIGLVGHAGGSELYNVLRVEVTDYLVGLSLAVAAEVTSTSDTSVTVHATPSRGVGPYTLQWYRSTTSGFVPSTATAIIGATGRDYTDTGLATGTTYYYRVVVTDINGDVATSSEVGVVPQIAPLTVGSLSRTLSTDNIALACAGTAGGIAPLQYQWHRAETFTQNPTWNGPTAIPNSNSLVLTDVPPLQGQVYSYVILVRDSQGVIATSTPVLALRYLSRLRLGILADTCFATHSDSVYGRHIQDWLGLYLPSAWGPRDVQIVDQTTAGGTSAHWAPGSDAYNTAVATFRAHGVTHVFYQYSWDGIPEASALTVNQLVADGFIVMLGQHQYTTQTPNGDWRTLGDGIASEGPAIRALANGTTIIACDMTTLRSGVAFGRKTTDPSILNPTSYLDTVDLHPSPYGIPVLAHGMAAAIARSLGWVVPS